MVENYEMLEKAEFAKYWKQVSVMGDIDSMTNKQIVDYWYDDPECNGWGKEFKTPRYMMVKYLEEIRESDTLEDSLSRLSNMPEGNIDEAYTKLTLAIDISRKYRFNSYSSLNWLKAWVCMDILAPWHKQNTYYLNWDNYVRLGGRIGMCRLLQSDY